MCYYSQLMTFCSIIFQFDSSSEEKIGVQSLISFVNREVAFPEGEDDKALGCFGLFCFLLSCSKKRGDSAYIDRHQNGFPYNERTCSEPTVIFLVLGYLPRPQWMPKTRYHTLYMLCFSLYTQTFSFKGSTL